MAITEQSDPETPVGPWRAIARAMLIPRVAWLAKGTPKDTHVGWDHFWSSVRSTGVGGDVLWDSADLDEIPSYLPLIEQHLDMTLPVVDVGCGNGRFTRRLAPQIPSIIGVDLSDRAVELARRESAGVTGVEFRTLDATAPGSMLPLAEEFGPMNVFVRGVFHVLSPADQLAMAKNLLPLVGSTGRVFLSETNFRGSQLGYLEHLGASPRHIPYPLERAIRDLPRPGHFGAEERATAFPAAQWSVVADGPTVIETIPLRGLTEPERIPGYLAIMAARIK